MKTAKEWIAALGMTAHIEGGYFKEELQSQDWLPGQDFDRRLYTSIYFLLEEGNPSHFHRLTADEVWYFHEGASLTIHMIFPDGRYEAVQLGRAIEAGEVLQYCVPKSVIFGSTVERDYALVSCMVAPGFDYRDFELMDRKSLLEAYPDLAEIITRLTREEEK